jgi:hypothetical protein
VLVVTSGFAGTVDVAGAAPPPSLHAASTSAPATVRRAQRRMGVSLPALADQGLAARSTVRWAATAAAVRRAWSTHAGTPIPS